MKFNKVVVIGNPPYQVNDGGGTGSSAKPIYHLFVEAAIDHLNPDYVSMIIPSRWMVGGKGLDSHRERMMNDTRMKKIVHFGGDNEVFGTVSIKGGVNYFLWDREHDGECEFVNGNTSVSRTLNQYDIILQDNNAFSILDKVLSVNYNGLDQMVSARKPFGLRSNFSDFKDTGIKCIINKKAERFVASDSFTDKNNLLDKWKVGIAGSGDGAASNADKNGMFSVIGTPFIMEPDTICTETYLVAYSCNTKKEAECFMSYMQSKFFRFMLSLRVSTQHVTREKYTWVPDLQDYSAPWTDAELYKKFGLTHQEIAYIESKIKTI